MAGNELDDVLSSLLGELDDLTLSLENDISSKSTGHPPPPPPPSMSAKPTFTAQSSFPPPPPPPPPPAVTQTDSSFLPPPPPPQAMKPAVSAVDDTTFIPPPPPLEITTAAQDEEDLSAMLDDLASFTEDLKENKPATKNKINLPTMEDSHQFGTLRRTGGSYLPPDFSDGTLDDNDDMTNALESLAKDIEISKEEEHMPTEAELANLSPVVNELEALAASLDQGAAQQEPQQVPTPPAIPSPALKPAIPPKIVSMPPPPPPKPEKSCFRKKPRSASNDHINQLDHHHHHHHEGGGSLSTASSSRSSLRSSSIITTDSSSATASSHDLHHSELPPPPPPPEKPRTVTFNLQPVVTEEAAAVDSVSVPSVDSGVDTLDSLSPEEREERLKSEKMKIALEKLKEARIQKLVVKVYNEDQSSKTLMIDERMTTRFVVNQLLEKNHFDFSQDWTIMEEIPSLFMERMFEEHEKPCDFLSYWTRDSTNQLRLLERKDKYALFKTPQRYLLPPSAAQERMPERQKQSLIEEFFSGGGPTTQVPELQGWLYIKGDGNKSWSRKYCVLRSSGLYVNKAGEPKKGKKLSDLSCLVMFEHIQLYHGRGWKKKFKSPFDYGFALKHPSIQVKSKQIRYLCCEDFATYMSWTVGIRLAKNGKLLLDNYNKTQEDLKSTSVVTSHLAMRQQQQADSQSRNSASSEGSGDKSTVRSTSSVASSKPVGVKSIFEGAWQRAAEEEGDAVAHYHHHAGGRPVAREKSVYNPASAGSKGGGNWWSLKDQSEGIPAGKEVPPPPPMPQTAPMPPPPPPEAKYQQQQQYYDEDEDDAQFGFESQLPPPPAEFNFNNNNSRKARNSSSSGKSKKKANSNSNNSKALRYSSEDSTVAIPDFQPPPPPRSAKPSPLTNYYSNGGSRAPNVSIDDFPPPPPFLLDLKESFREALKQKSQFDERRLIEHLPPPPNAVLSVIQHTSNRKKGGKPPPPPQRSSTTKLSFNARRK